MVETMGRTDTPKGSIKNLLCVRQTHFHQQPLDWEYLLDVFVEPSGTVNFRKINQERMQYLMMYGFSDRVEALPFKIWRDDIRHMIQTADYKWGRDYWGNSWILRQIRAKLNHFEGTLTQLKAITTILENALWKMTINEKNRQDVATQSQKKIKTDESINRQQCRVICGADVVIGHVLPFLITT
jgi:hypothetical protein